MCTLHRANTTLHAQTDTADAGTDTSTTAGHSHTSTIARRLVVGDRAHYRARSTHRVYILSLIHI
eukprot:3846130-Alexandrium_andersonii.AAC.1